MLQEQTLPSREGLVALRPSSLHQAAIQLTIYALHGKEELKKEEVPDVGSYTVFLFCFVVVVFLFCFLSASNPRLVPRGRYVLLPRLFRGTLLPQMKRIGLVPLGRNLSPGHLFPSLPSGNGRTWHD